MSIRMPSRSKLSTSMPCVSAQHLLTRKAVSSDPSFQRNWPNSPVANETAAYSGASHSPSGTRSTRTQPRAIQALMYCQYTNSRNSLTMQPIKAAPSGRSMLSPSTASGRGEPEEGSRRRCGCQTAVPARFRVSPPDSGVVPFSEKPLPPIKSDFGFSGRVGLPLESIVMPSSSPVTTWGRSGILRGRAYGIS
jgi:hypothetical protein